MNAINLTCKNTDSDNRLLKIINDIQQASGGPIVCSIERMPLAFNSFACAELKKCHSYIKRNLYENIVNIADTIHLNLPLFVNNTQRTPFVCAVIFDCDIKTFNLLSPYLNVMNVLPIRIK